MAQGGRGLKELTSFAHNCQSSGLTTESRTVNPAPALGLIAKHQQQQIHRTAELNLPTIALTIMASTEKWFLIYFAGPQLLAIGLKSLRGGVGRFQLFSCLRFVKDRRLLRKGYVFLHSSFTGNLGVLLSWHLYKFHWKSYAQPKMD